MSRRYEAVANPATPSTPHYDRVFPPPTVTPGLQASCPTSQCWPDVALSLYLTSNAKITSSQHELTTALSADRRRGGGQGGSDGKHHLLCAFDVIVRNFKAPAIRGGAVPPLPARLVPGDLKAILKTSGKITWFEETDGEIVLGYRTMAI